MTIVLDTNVVSEGILRAGDQRVVDWLDRQAESDLYLAVVTAAELTYAVLRLPVGRRRAELETEVRAVLDQDFARRIFTYDLPAAKACASIMAQRERAGRPVQIADAQIAGICLARRVTLATRNTKGFDDCGVALVNPWEQA